jgi:septal ring factor EnvC (AmiA/AmiB activator)
MLQLCAQKLGGVRAEQMCFNNQRSKYRQVQKGTFMKRTDIFAASLALLIGISTLQQPAQARYTINERQVRLQKEISQGVKANELTKKEADDLKSSMADIDSRIAKMKEKNAGKISIKDQKKLEKSLNDVSVKITKLRLDKRVK